MALFQTSAAAAAAASERRAEYRNPVECPAKLHLTVAQHSGTLWDLSLTGARFQTDKPPMIGMTALLQWSSHEAFCKVMWATGEMCGLAFDRPLKPWLVDETVYEEAVRSGPIAAVTNIPLGQRRSRI
ncbi:MAG: PilZ domain-containing protein [Croceibacterium sp.]